MAQAKTMRSQKAMIPHAIRTAININVKVYVKGIGDEVRVLCLAETARMRRTDGGSDPQRHSRCKHRQKQCIWAPKIVHLLILSALCCSRRCRQACDLKQTPARAESHTSRRASVFTSDDFTRT